MLVGNAERAGADPRPPELPRLRVNQVGRVRCERSWFFDSGRMHRFTDHDFWFVWAGTGKFHFPDGASIPLRPGACIVMQPNGAYRAEHDPGNRLGIVFIHFQPDGRGSFDVGTLPRHCYPENGPFIEMLLGRIVASCRDPSQRAELVRRAGPDYPGDIFRLVLTELMGFSTAESEPSDMRHARARAAALAAANRILDNPAECGDIAALASEAGQSAGHFRRVFRETLGMSPKQYIVRARLQRARKLLEETDLTVSQVSDMLGYSSPQFFSRQYHLHLGSPPTHVRRGDGW